MDVERTLAALESEAKPAIERLERREALQDTERKTITMFAALLQTRVPEFEHCLTEVANAVMTQFAKVAFADPDRARSTMAKLERETGARSPTGAEEMVTYFERCGFGIELERHYSLGVSLRLAETIAQILLSKHWYVSHCPPGKSLITTDTPFAIFAPPNVVNAPYGVGLATLGATAFVPLGAEIGLSFAEPGDGVTHLDTRDAVIRDMNLRLAVRSKRFVFARDERHLRSRQFDKPGNPCSVSSTTRRLTNPVAPSPTELDPGHSLRMARTLGADKCALYVKKRCRANTAQLREAPRVDGALHVMPLVRDCYA